MTLVRLYHVPRSQVWPGSRGRQTGRIHLHRDGASKALCGRGAWYPRPPDPDEQKPMCARCLSRAERLGESW